MYCGNLAVAIIDKYQRSSQASVKFDIRYSTFIKVPSTDILNLIIFAEIGYVLFLIYKLQTKTSSI